MGDAKAFFLLNTCVVLLFFLITLFSFYGTASFGFRVICLWVQVVHFAVYLGQFGVGIKTPARIFCKDSKTGRYAFPVSILIRPLLQCLLWPVYRAGQRSFRKKQNPWDRILPGLYLGEWVHADNEVNDYGFRPFPPLTLFYISCQRACNW